jgi:peptide/nickel transport system permease protein
VRYAIGRIAYAISLIAATIFLSFVLFHLVPADPARIALGPNASQAQVAALRVQLGLDQPWPVQLAGYLRALFRGDLGRSLIDGRAVGPEVAIRLSVSTALTLMASAIAGIWVIAQASVSSNGRAPYAFAWANSLFTAFPTMFVAAVALAWLLPHYPWDYFPGTLKSVGAWAFLLLPASVLALYPMGILGKIMDREFARLAARPFVEAARARGLSPGQILWRHMTPNALIPLLSGWITLLPILLTGSFIIEIMFSVPGLGALLLRSVLNRDLPMLQGVAIIASALAVVLHLVVELAYPAIDPRIVGGGRE